MTQLILTAVPHIPHIQPGDDLIGLILDALQVAEMSLDNGDILAVAQKIISKAEGRLVRLADVQPGERAVAVAAETDKDPRIVDLAGK